MLQGKIYKPKMWSIRRKLNTWGKWYWQIKITCVFAVAEHNFSTSGAPLVVAKSSCVWMYPKTDCTACEFITTRHTWWHPSNSIFVFTYRELPNEYQELMGGLHFVRFPRKIIGIWTPHQERYSRELNDDW